MAKQEYFVDFYKDKYGEREIKVEAMWDINNKELYNGAKAKYIHSDGTEELGKIVIWRQVGEDYNSYYTYSFKPKKGSQLYIYDSENVELI